nr:immunoglobulin heavy chain junction region [Mus musculus]
CARRKAYYDSWYFDVW